MGQETDPVTQPALDSVQPRIRIRERPKAASGDEIQPAVPRHLEFIFEERFLLPGEQVEQYDNLLRVMVRQVIPTDVIEALWTKEIIDLIWEARRYRRYRNQILAQARHKAAVACILPILKVDNSFDITPDFFHQDRAEDLASGWLTGDERKGAEFEEKLSRRSLTPMDVAAHAFHSTLPEVERIERMIASADQRRDALLRDIVRKRSTLGNRLRDASAAVIDAETSGTGTVAAVGAEARK